MTELRVLTVRQPWASLIALGYKRIEVRSRPTKYRGWVAIHAAMWRSQRDADEATQTMLDLGMANEVFTSAFVGGAIVAVARLVDSLPIVPREWPMYAIPSVSVHAPDDPAYPRLLHWKDGDPYADNVTDQLPYAPEHMWTPGHHAWILYDVRPVDPIPHKGGLGLRHATPEIAGLLAPHIAVASS